MKKHAKRSRTPLDSKQLSALIGALARDVQDSVIHWKLAKGLEEAMGLWPLVKSQSNTFWSLTMVAHIKVSILAACRAFDQQKDALHLYGLLEHIRENLGLFDDQNFRERQKGNPFVDSLAATPRRPDPQELIGILGFAARTTRW